MKNVALITGATGGLGREFVDLFARDGYNLLLTGRNEKKLSLIKKEAELTYGITAEVFPCDLAKSGAAEKIYSFAGEKQAEVTALVNNAGFGDFCEFYRESEEKLSDMVQVNAAVPVALTRLFLPAMVQRKSGVILNVASVAAFAPGPLMSVYYASKAFMLSFSEGLHQEVKKYGVKVSALCPGPTQTGFESAADLEKSGLFKNLKIASAKKTAAYGYKKAEKGKAVAVHGFSNRFLTFLMKISPRALVRKCVYNIQKEKE